MSLRRPVRYKADDIWDTPDDGNRYEVIDGVLSVTPPPNFGHQYAASTLHGHLWQHIYPRGLGVIVTAPTGVVLDDDNGLQPDLLYVSNERRHIISARGVEGAPDLVVEILSPSTRSKDRGVKLRLYAAAGVPRYWILDPRARTLKARRLTSGGYELTGTYGPGEVFRPDLFRGLEIPIDALWT